MHNTEGRNSMAHISMAYTFSNAMTDILILTTTWIVLP